MIDDRAGARIPKWGAALLAIHRVCDGFLGRSLSHAQPFDAHAKAGVVHHREHARHAAIRWTDHPALRIIKLHDAGRRSMQAQLMFQRYWFQRVGNTRFAVFIRDQLGNDKQRDTFGAGRRVRQAGKDQMADIFRQIMIAPGNVDFLSTDGIGPVIIRRRLGSERTDIGPGLRFSQIHRAGPAAFDQFWKIHRLDLIARMMLQRIDLALGHQRVER